MESLELKPFNKIKHIEDRLVLDWTAGIAPNINEPDNPLIDCYFTPIKFHADRGIAGRWGRAPSRQIRAGVPVGYLPSLYLGQHFQSGRRLSYTDWPDNQKIIFEFDTRDDNSITECTLPSLKIDTPLDFIAHKHKYAAHKAGIKKIDGKILHSNNPKVESRLKNKPDDLTVVIPEIELIRFYLTNSTFSSKQIFSHAFANERLFIDVINAKHEKPHINKDMHARFVCRHRYKSEDIFTLARILFEPNKLALNAAQRVHKCITTDRINYVSGSIGYPKTYFPFSAKTQVQVFGRYLKLKGEDNFIFLVNRILSCSAPFPFKTLSYCNELTKGGKPADDPKEAPFSNNLHYYHGPAHESNFFGESVGDQRPKSHSKHISTQLGYRNFSGLQSIPWEHKKTKDCTHGSKGEMPKYLEELINASTGEGTSGESDSAPQTITERVTKPSTVTPDLETFVEILASLKKFKPEWGISTVCIDNCEIESDVSYSFFPMVYCKKRTNILRQFSFMDEEKEITRRLICVEINMNNKYLYLFEAQRRLKTNISENSKSPYKENLPILLLYKSDYSNCIGNDFIHFLQLTVKNSTWPKQVPQFNRAHTVHGLGAQIPETIAVRIIDLINKNV